MTSHPVTGAWVPIVDTPGVAHRLNPDPARTVWWPNAGGDQYRATLCGQAAVHPIHPVEVRSHCTACTHTGNTP